jgi:D-alanyl-D-alanine carboxypeptidase (penicillin-binding protein 5/6)
MPRQWRSSAKITVEYETPLAAPIARGDMVGNLVVSGQGVPGTRVPLMAGADVARLGLPGRAIAVLTHFVTGS